MEASQPAYRAGPVSNVVGSFPIWSELGYNKRVMCETKTQWSSVAQTFLAYIR